VPDRCGEPKLISTVKGEPREEIAVPQAGRDQLVILKISGAEIEGLERLKSLVWKPPIRVVGVDGGPAGSRLVPGTTGDGMIVSRGSSFEGPPETESLPQLSHIRMEGVSRPLEFRFYRIDVHPVAEKKGRSPAN
jgi:hypothetical protein